MGCHGWVCATLAIKAVLGQTFPICRHRSDQFRADRLIRETSATISVNPCNTDKEYLLPFILLCLSYITWFDTQYDAEIIGRFPYRIRQQIGEQGGTPRGRVMQSYVPGTTTRLRVSVYTVRTLKAHVVQHWKVALLRNTRISPR